MNCGSYTAIMESLKPAISGPVETLHIKCNTLPTTVFEAPITEVNVFKLKEAQNLGAFVKIVGDADKIMHLLKGCRTPTSWGESLPTPLIVSGLIGWDSIEVSNGAIDLCSCYIAQRVRSLYRTVHLSARMSRLARLGLKV